jgi:hypothetical protein
MKGRSLLAALIPLLAWSTLCHAQWKFESLHLGVSDECLTSALGDLNSDKHTDIFCVVLINSTYTVRTFLWTSGKDSTSHYRDAGDLASISTGAARVISVSAADFNHDGKLDLLVTCAGDAEGQVR